MGDSESVDNTQEKVEQDEKATEQEADVASLTPCSAPRGGSGTAVTATAPPKLEGTGKVADESERGRPLKARLRKMKKR